MTMRTTSGNEVRGGGRGLAARPVRPVERRGPVRPGGRRPGPPLPPVRPAVSGGSGGSGGSARVAPPAPSPAVVRRRRVAAVLVATVLAVVVAVLVLASLSSAAAAEAPAGAVTVVRAGETLQDVARRTAPDGDERAVAGRIRDLNGLASSNVSPGRPLLVPAG